MVSYRTQECFKKTSLGNTNANGYGEYENDKNKNYDAVIGSLVQGLQRSLPAV